MATNKADNQPVEECTAWGVCKATGAETGTASGDVAPWNETLGLAEPTGPGRQRGSPRVFDTLIALTFDFGTKNKKLKLKNEPQKHFSLSLH